MVLNGYFYIPGRLDLWPKGSYGHPRAHLVYRWLWDWRGGWGWTLWAWNKTVSPPPPSVKRYVKGSLETGFSVHRWLQRGTWGGGEGSFTRNFEKQVIIWSSSIRDSMRCVQEGSERGISLQSVPSGWTLEAWGELLYWGHWESGKRRLWKQIVSLFGSCVMGTWR
jgi:hypothetical protein